MKQTINYGKRRIGHGGQRGGLTIFTAALVLILMTVALVYATRVSLLESRISSNEVRQKEAFHVAEAAMDQGVMYLLQNAQVLLSSRTDVFQDGAGTFTRDGWFDPAAPRWQPCPITPAATHPCGGAVGAPTDAFYYDTDGDTSTVESLPVNQLDFPAGSTARMSALLCFVDVSTGLPCIGNPGTASEEAQFNLVLTLLSYGYSDCTDTNTVSTCTGEARVAMPVSNYRKLSGSPAVPLVSKATFPPQGTAEIVGNPNGGGVGVPLTTWLNANTTGACVNATPITSSGTWQTCEMEEWYHTTDYPPGVACTDNNCMCGPGGNDSAYFLSWKSGADTNINIDIIEDTSFPCDLFEFYFGPKRADYLQIKSTADEILTDCSSLGPQSSGLIWVKGNNCSIGGNTTIGSPQKPVILVSAATLTTINAGAVIFGVLYIFDDDPAGSTAEIKTTGGATVYGAVIVDGAIDKFQGTFQVVYSEKVLAEAAGIAGLGSVNGGWRDFGLPDIAW